MAAIEASGWGVNKTSAWPTRHHGIGPPGRKGFRKDSLERRMECVSRCRVGDTSEMPPGKHARAAIYYPGTDL